MAANGDKNEVEINQLYFKKSGNSKSLVALNSDRDVPAMLQEYPLQYPSGKRKIGRKAVITMAVDWAAIHEHTQESTQEQSFDSPGISLCLTPRRSPRLADKARKVIEPQKEMDVFVFEAIKAKTEVAGNTTAARKRSLDFSSSASDGVMEDIQMKKIKAGDNELWNDVHCSRQGFGEKGNIGTTKLRIRFTLAVVLKAWSRFRLPSVGTDRRIECGTERGMDDDDDDDDDEDFISRSDSDSDTVDDIEQYWSTVNAR
ncbi:hypothetical protein QZH41_019688 [Actinostola sp. cb2023]|nr:hypothetical protein QZH41_019688 [Actinostola sp. cb2023]